MVIVVVVVLVAVVVAGVTGAVVVMVTVIIEAIVTRWKAVLRMTKASLCIAFSWTDILQISQSCGAAVIAAPA